MATKTEIVIRIMKENAGKSMAEVLPLLQAEFGWSEKNARAAYALRVKADPSLGVLEKAVTRRPGKANGLEPKSSKPKLIKVPKPRIAGDKEQAEKAKLGKTKTAEEIADIRAKNLARLKAVGRKYAKGQYAEGKAGRDHTDEEARDIVSQMESDLDSFQAPKFLNMAEVKALV